MIMTHARAQRKHGSLALELSTMGEIVIGHGVIGHRFHYPGFLSQRLLLVHVVAFLTESGTPVAHTFRLTSVLHMINNCRNCAQNFFKLIFVHYHRFLDAIKAQVRPDRRPGKTTASLLAAKQQRRTRWGKVQESLEKMRLLKAVGWSTEQAADWELTRAGTRDMTGAEVSRLQNLKQRFDTTRSFNRPIVQYTHLKTNKFLSCRNCAQFTIHSFGPTFL